MSGGIFGGLEKKRMENSEEKTNQKFGVATRIGPLFTALSDTMEVGERTRRK
jgi:hypothetical protein